jgi:hypothetical protein
MLALTVIQPWASAIMGLGKDVENRGWLPPHKLLGQRFAIHAGKKLEMGPFSLFVYDFAFTRDVFDEERYPTGALLGTVELVGYFARCEDGNEGYAVRDPRDAGLVLMAGQESRWSTRADCQWVLRNPRPLARPIPMRGAQGLWRVPESHAALLGECTPMNLSVPRPL